jgi:hypothetical protein
MAARDAQAKRHWPEGMAFDAAHEELLRRGWPAMRVFGPDEPKPAAIATKHLKALDPTRFVVWPREAARLYVRAFAQGMGGFQTTVKVDAADAGEVDAAVLDAVLSRMGSLGYGFLMRDALLLAEAFLGPRVAAERTIAALEAYVPGPHERPAMWAYVVIACLELFVLRADDDALHEDVEKRLRAIVARIPSSGVAWRCRLTLEGTAAWDEVKTAFHYDVEHLRIDEGAIDAYLTHEYADWLFGPQIARMFGMARAPAKLVSAAKRQAAWKQEERCVAFAPVEHPLVGTLMSAMVGSKGAKGLPEAWLAAHPELAPSGTSVDAPAAAKKA